MGKRNKKLKSKKQPNSQGIQQLRSIHFEDFDKADRTFLEHLADDTFSPPPEKATDTKESHEPRQGRQTPHHRKAKTNIKIIDLHGLTEGEAKTFLDREIYANLSKSAMSSHSFKIITGKGKHSGPGGGVLVSEIHKYILLRYGPNIVRIDSSPAETMINGLPWRGYFSVTIKNDN